MNQSELHSRIVTRVCAKIQMALLDKVIVEKRQVGLFKRQGSDHSVKVGITGMADIAVIFHGGMIGQIEVKTGGATLRPQQLLWKDKCERMGIPYMLLHVEDESKSAEALSEAVKWAAAILQLSMTA